MTANQRAVPATILLVLTDEQEARNLSWALSTQYECIIVSSAAEALALVGTHPVDVIICDARLEDMSGTQCLFDFRTRQPYAIRFLCGLGTDSSEFADALHVAAVYEYLRKPLFPELVTLSLKRALEYREISREHRQLTHDLSRHQKSKAVAAASNPNQPSLQFDGLFFCSQAMHKICELAKRAATTDLPILIYGETGTGKELLARGIHYHSHRREQIFLAQNCGGVPAELLQSELFGHHRGAYTGALSDRLGLFSAADGGTVLLDEIEDMSVSLQANLLRFLQSGEVKPLGSDKTHYSDVRIIAVTNVPLDQLVEQGNFRQDLYYRLKGLEISIPPLRDRPEDIQLLAEHFAKQFSTSLGKSYAGIGHEALNILQQYPFPGNVRELENEIRRTVALAPSGQPITADRLSDTIINYRIKEPKQPIPTGESGTLKELTENLERSMVISALKRCHGNQSRAAEALGLSRVGLANKIKRYAIDIEIS
ncbi:sigma-54 dependent transcriptional regulator [Acidithiobacillus ferruginosus]|uniref:Sigma-54-dependent Fis family transcriptional regulator n=3 Tax=Acidithiobacillus TaxID=119977 RepID=A0A5P9XPZ0_ACITH|nr:MULTISPECIES: sigma-54 dependent transcriptional regulator [Acidithiobacillus]MBU2813421.1 sigma-54-dependent Fis family transcriptional regulator [Acidithiobacillus ferruginosus]MBU2832155.1 sigma-54-dependent Fis family transcriptional regulator [Acidithiobacillus ferriphilus]QFX96075.1 sigma-54-dependent Fis family transcriptional regulator [Acidithiobacillus thiooxidans ATCC 19377]